MANRTDEMLKLRGADTVVDQIMDVYGEAAEVHEQALMAMGQLPFTSSSPVASTKSVVNLTSDLSSRRENR